MKHSFRNETILFATIVFIYKIGSNEFRFHHSYNRYKDRKRKPVIFKNIPSPIITKEHGSWAVLLVPIIVGTIYADIFTWNVMLLGASALLVFMTYVPVHSLLQYFFGAKPGKDKIRGAFFWSIIYFLAGLGFIVPLFLQQYWFLIHIGAIGLLLFFGNFYLTKRTKKSIGSDLVAVSGLTLGAPAAYYISTGRLGTEAASVWLLSFLFFGCSIFYVHMKMQVSGMKKERWKWEEKITAGSLNILYHVAVIGIVALLALYHITPAMVILAFVPMFVHAVVGTIQLHRRVKFRHLGFLLLGQSVLFCIAIALSISSF